MSKQAKNLAVDLRTRRQRSVQSMIGRVQLTPEQADKLLTGTNAVREREGREDVQMARPNCSTVIKYSACVFRLSCQRAQKPACAFSPEHFISIIHAFACGIDVPVQPPSAYPTMHFHTASSDPLQFVSSANVFCPMPTWACRPNFPGGIAGLSTKSRHISYHLVL